MNNFPLLDSIIESCKVKNKIEDAKTFLKIASQNCNDLSLLDRIAFFQSEIKDYLNCIESLKLCLNLAQDRDSKFSIRANTAKTYNHLNEPVLSLAYSKINSNDRFDYDTLMEMSFSYYLSGDYVKSEAMMRELVTHSDLPEDVRGRVEYNLGSYDIENGDFKKGLKGFIEIGHKIGIWKSKSIDGIPNWKGEEIKDKTIIIQAEGGIGDEIIGVRFVHKLKQLGAKPIWISNHEHLCDVFNRNGIISQTSLKNIDKTNTVQCQAMFLPLLLDLDKDQIWYGSYLQPSQEYVDKWKKILPAGRKLAVKWSGNPYYDQDLHRSIPIEHIRNIKFDGTKINLQLELELYQPDMFNAGEHIKNIDDTLAILSLCDNLVTSCTSVAHMNGAMSKNGIVCPPIACYYIWLGDATWYPSMYITRQTKHKDWKFVENLL